MEDVARGFVISVGRVVREFVQVLREGEGVETQTQTQAQGENVPVTEGDEREPRVSILPIEPEVRGDESEKENKIEREYAFVGRNKEEVERRLGEVEEERVRRELGEL